jgi:hypothetical protein
VLDQGFVTGSEAPDAHAFAVSLSTANENFFENNSITKFL